MTLNTATQRVKEMSDNAWLTGLGRVAQLVGVPLLVALVIWQLNKQSTLQTSLNDVGGRMYALEQKVTDMAADQYHGADAKRDFALRDLQIGADNARLIDLDGRVRTLEIGSARSRR